MWIASKVVAQVLGSREFEKCVLNCNHLIGGKERDIMNVIMRSRFDLEELEQLANGVKTWLRSNTCDRQIDEALGLLNKLNVQKRKLEVKAQKQTVES